MKSQKNTIAIITARAGSKRIKNKNIISFFGKPMIAYSINCAKKSRLFDEIFVSTDSNKIKKISLKYGAKVPFIRSKKLSNDFTGTQEVIKNFLQKLKKKYKYVCCIYPTAPLMRFNDLIKGYQKLRLDDSNYIFSANLYKKDLNENFFLYKGRKFADSGQFYWATYNIWMKKLKILNKNSSIIKIPRIHAQDLNTFKDLRVLKKNALNLLKKE